MGLLDWALQFSPWQQNLKEQQAKEKASQQSITNAYANQIRTRQQQGQTIQPAVFQRYQDQLNETTPGAKLDPSTLRTLDIANKVSNNYVGRNLLTGLAQGNPISLVGNVLEYGNRGVNALSGGRLNANIFQGMSNFGQVDQNAPAKTAFQSRGIKDDLFRGGVQLGLDWPAFASSSYRILPMAKYFTQSANNSSRGLENAGYSPLASFLGGTGMGTANAALERLGMKEVTGKVLKQGAKEAGVRILKSFGTEGGTEAAQQFADNAFAKATYDPQRQLRAGVAENFLVGGVLGGAGRVPFEIYNSPHAKQQIKQRTIPIGRQLDAEIKAQEAMIRKAPNATVRKRHEKAYDALIKERTRIMQGGYIAGPKALGFGDAKKQGRVFEGVDKKPRFEVSDERAKVNIDAIYDNGYNANLDQVLDHPTLFKNYPELKKVKVTVDAMDNSTNAVFDDKTNTITLNENQLEGMDVKGTILHELQHSIQEKEGFARGGNVGLDAEKAYNEMLFEKQRKLRNQYEKNPTPELREQIRAVNQEISDSVNNAKDNTAKGYKNLAGEAEARAVQARMDMPMSERYAKPEVDPSKAPEKWQGLIKDSREFTNPDDFVKSKQMDYHGTEQSFKRFSNSAIGSRGEPGFTGKGFYFTNRKNYAREYGKNVMEAHLNIKNPYVLDNAPGGFGVPYSPELIKERLKLPSDATPADITKKLKDMGHDGVVVNVIDASGRKKNGFEKMVIDAEDIWNPETLKALHEKTRPRSTFYDSLDVPKEDLIVRDGSGKAMSVEPAVPDKYVQEYADILKSIDDQAGVEIVGNQRMSGHSQFYRDYFKQYGRKPSKQAWLEHARQEVVKDKDFMSYVQDEVKSNRAVEPPQKLSKDEWASIMSRPEAQPRVRELDATGKTLKINKGDSVVDTGEPNIKTKIEGDFKTSTNQYLGSITASRTQAFKFMESLPKIDPAKAKQAILSIDSGVPTGDAEVDAFATQFKQLTDQLYARYKNNGIDMGYVDNYLPRIYKDANGQAITRDEYLYLKRSTGRTQNRVATEVNPEDLLYKTPEQLLGHYVKTMEKVVAGRQYFDNLLKQGYIVEAGTRPQGMKLIDAEGISQPRQIQMDDGSYVQGNYYAEPDVANALNKVFGSQSENKVLKVTAKVSSVAQDIGLSGGIPGTPLNAFSFAQFTKELSAGRVIGPMKALRNSFSQKQAAKYFLENADIKTEMEKQGIAVNSEYDTALAQALSGEMPDSTMSKLWNKTMSDPTFKRFMPILQMEMYKNARAHTDAQTAAQIVKNFYGLTDMATTKMRSKNMNNLATTTLFAPKFRESMINFWMNNAKALRHPTDINYRQNARFMVGATLTFGVMQALNYSLNGVFTWDNPNDKKDKLIIPGSPLTGGKDVGVPFLSSIATVPRSLVSGIYGAVANQDPKQLYKTAKGFASYALRPMLDLADNENYFGSRIYDPNGTPGEKIASQSSYLVKAYQHPYVREALNAASNYLPEDVKKYVGASPQSTFETLSKAGELPLRFYNPDYYKGQSPDFGKGRAVGTKVDTGTVQITDKTEKKGNTYVTRNKYDAVIDATEKGSDGLPPVNNYDNQQLIQAVKDVNSEAKQYLDNLGVPTDSVKFDTKLARKYAQYQQKIDGANQIEKDKLAKSFARDALKSGLSEIEQNLYTLSKDDLAYYIGTGAITEENLQKALAVEKQLYNSGLISKETLARKLGTSARGYKGSGSKKISVAKSSTPQLAKYLSMISQANQTPKIVRVNPTTITNNANIQLKKASAPAPIYIKYS